MKKSISFVFFGLLISLAVTLGALHSGWGQNKVRSWIVSSLAEEGILADIQSFEGFLVPNQVVLTGVQFHWPSVGSLTIEKIKASVALLYLLKNEICLKEAEVLGAVWTSERSSLSPPTESSPSQLSLPMSFSVKSLKASNVRIDQLEPLDLQGHFRARAHQKGLSCKIRARHREDQASFFFSKRKSGFARWNINLKVEDTSWLSSIYQLPFNGHLELKIKGETQISKKIQGSFEGKFLPQKSIEEVRFPWVFKGRLLRDTDRLWSFSHVTAQDKDMRLGASLSLNAEGKLQAASGELESKKLFLPSVQGELLARWTVRREDDKLIGKTVAHIPLLKAQNFSWHDVELIVDSENTQGSFEMKGQDWSSKGQFAWTDHLELPSLQLESPQLKGDGAWEFFKNGSMKGFANVQVENLQILKPLAPELDPYGRLQLKTTWDEHQVKLDMSAKNLYLKSFYFEEAFLYSDLQDPLHELSGTISIDMEKGQFRDLRIDAAQMETTLGKEKSPFKLFAEGVWNRDFELHSEGFWTPASKEISVAVQDFHGLFYSHPFSLQETVNLFLSPEKKEISQTYLKMQEAKIEGQFLEEPNLTAFSLKLTDFPLDCLSINPLEVSVTGKLNFEGEGKEVNGSSQGKIQAFISDVEIARLGEPEPITAQGEIKGELNSDQLLLNGHLSTRGQPLASFDLQCPLRLHLRSGKIDWLDQRPMMANAHLDGQIEDFLDFFNLQSHWLQGRCMADFVWSNTLKNPHVEGLLQLTDGYYENYLTGTQLTDLQIQLVAEKDHLNLKSLSAKDQEKEGTLFADGKIKLDIEKKFPFDFHLAFHHFHFIELGFASAKTDSAIEIRGDIEKALATGEVHIVQCDLSIPENLTKSPPHLDVVYLNAEKPLPTPPSSPATSYPLSLDLTIDTPQPVSIAGRGLKSEWKGQFTLKGTHFAPQPFGTLELMNGEFSFSGRFFKLTQGSLTFNAQNRLIPYLNLSGATEQKGISILAHLEGPLNHPQLTFQSVPPLPLSAIISYLLFGQDISEINGLQALQLATSVANIAGQSPDVLESTRRSLGIDRLRIVSEPTGEGDETISIQVGKYIAEGVLVSISQSTDNSAPNISIEVDIGKGFFFQAETDQLQEQGKFGIKWNRNY